MIDVGRLALRRRTVMQGTLWVVLGWTVLLAAAVDHHIRNGLYVPLTEAIVDGPFSFSLPLEWKMSARSGPGDARLHVASDPSGAGDGDCVMTVIRQRVDRLMTPVEYLHFSGQLEGTIAELPSETMLVDDWPGQWFAWVRRSQASGGGESHGMSYCVVLPNREAISVQLERTRALDKRDVRRMKQILDSVHISMRPGFGPIILADGTRITVPANFVVYEQPDPLCQDRMIVLRPSKGGWISARLVGLTLSGQPNSALLSGLAAGEHFDFRDPSETERWLTARIDQERADLWRIDPQDPADHLVRRRAYVLIGGKNVGLAVVLTAVSPAEDEEIDSTWAMLAGNIQLGEGAELEGMLDAGAKVAPPVAAASDRLPPETSEEQWWLWTRSGAAVGWTRGWLDKQTELPSRKTILRNWEGTVTRVEERWNFNDNPVGALARVTRFDTDVEPTSRFAYSFDDTTEVAHTLMKQIEWGGPPIPVSAVEAPRAFVLSARFPQLLSRVADEPTAFWTDRFPGVDSEVLPSPILLLARPADSGQAGLRCVEVEVNGTGRLSRWYFRGDGTLDHALLPGDLSMLSSSKGQIESEMESDPRLTVPRP